MCVHVWTIFLQIVTVLLHVHYGMCACFLNEQASFKYVYLWFKYSVVIAGQSGLLPACASYDTCFGCMISCEQERVPDMLQYPKGIVFLQKEHSIIISGKYMSDTTYEKRELRTLCTRITVFKILGLTINTDQVNK